MVIFQVIIHYYIKKVWKTENVTQVFLDITKIIFNFLMICNLKKQVFLRKLKCYNYCYWLMRWRWVCVNKIVFSKHTEINVQLRFYFMKSSETLCEESLMDATG